MFESGDILVFQLESGYGLMKVLAKEGPDDDPVWHLRVYEDLFLETDAAEKAAVRLDSLSVSIEHAALTNRAFESTPVAPLLNQPSNEEELSLISDWQAGAEKRVFDRSIRLLMGLR